jgi:hypothetical protein
MKERASYIRPPRLAGWIVGLFTLDDKTESIRGDLIEEFPGIVRRSGITAARRWYWKQSVRSSAHLAFAAFRGAPLSMSAAALLGPVLFVFAVSLPSEVATGYIASRPVIAYIDPGLFMWIFGILLGQVGMLTLVGSAIAFLLKGREIVAVALPGLVASTQTFVLIAQFAARLHQYDLRFPPLPLIGLAFSFLFFPFAGAVIVRSFRSALEQRLYASQ